MSTATISTINPKLEITLVRSAAKAANKEQRTLVQNVTTGKPMVKKKS